MKAKVQKALQAVMATVNNGSYSDYEKELDKYDAIVEQAIEAGMKLEDIKALEDEAGFIA